MAARRTRHPAALLMRIRTLHTWLGLLIAPTVLFMATTGILQIYGLHEGRPGYTPPALIEKFGRLHKDQVFAQDRHGPPPEFLRALRAAGKGRRGFGLGPRPEPRAPRPAVILLKAFLTAAAVGLIVSTLLGLWMALREGQKRLTHGLLLLAGVAIPVVLAALTA
jgi:hypothetical protein